MSRNHDKVTENPTKNISFTQHFTASTAANQFMIRPVTDKIVSGGETCFEIITTKPLKTQSESKNAEELKSAPSSFVEAFCKQTGENQQQPAAKKSDPDSNSSSKQRHTSTIFIGSSKIKEAESSNSVSKENSNSSGRMSKISQVSKCENSGFEESEPRRRQRGANKNKPSNDSSVKKVVTISAKNLEAKTISLTNNSNKPNARKVYTRKMHNTNNKSFNNSISSSSENETSSCCSKQESQKIKTASFETEETEKNLREQRRNRRIRARMVNNKQQSKPHLLKQQLSAENVCLPKTEIKKTTYRRQRRSKELKAGGGAARDKTNLNIPPSMIKRSHPWAKQIFMLNNEVSDEDKYSTLPANFRPSYDLVKDAKNYNNKVLAETQSSNTRFKPASNFKNEKLQRSKENPSIPNFKEIVSLHNQTKTKTPDKRPMKRVDSEKRIFDKSLNVPAHSNKSMQTKQLNKSFDNPTETQHNGEQSVPHENINAQNPRSERFSNNNDSVLNEKKQVKTEIENESSRNSLIVARPLAKAKKIGEHFWPRDKDTEKLLGKNSASQETEQTPDTDKTDGCTKTDSILQTNVEKDDKADQKDQNHCSNLEDYTDKSKIKEEKCEIESKNFSKNPFEEELKNPFEEELNNPFEEELKKFSKITQDMKVIEENRTLSTEKEINSFNFDKINSSLTSLDGPVKMNDDVNRAACVSSQRKNSVVSQSTALPTRKPSYKQISAADYDEAVIEIDEVINEFQNIAYANSDLSKNSISTPQIPSSIDNEKYLNLQNQPKVKLDKQVLNSNNIDSFSSNSTKLLEEKQINDSYDGFTATETISPHKTAEISNRLNVETKSHVKKKSHSDPNTNAVRKASLLNNIEVEKRPNSCSEPFISEKCDTLSGLDKYKAYQISKTNTNKSHNFQNSHSVKPHQNNDIYAPDKLLEDDQSSQPNLNFDHSFELGKEEKQFKEMCDILTSSTVSIHQPDFAPSSGQVISHSRSCSAPVPTDQRDYDVCNNNNRRYATIKPTSLLEDMKNDESLLGAKKQMSTSADNLNSNSELQEKYLPVSLLVCIRKIN